MESDSILIKIDPEIRELIPEFLENRKNDVKSILCKLHVQDFDNIYDLGHRMKGAGTMYGFKKISVLGKLIEKAAEEKSAIKIKVICDELEHYLKIVEII